MAENNVEKGKVLVLLARNAADTAYELIGGVKARGFNVTNNFEDTTSSSTQGDYTESDWDGFSGASIDISGLADKRTGVIDTATGLAIVGDSRLQELATTGQRSGKFKFYNTATGGAAEGFFGITNYKRDGDTPGLAKFSCTMQSKSDLIITGVF